MSDANKIFSALKENFSETIKQKVNQGIESTVDVAGLASQDDVARLQQSVLKNRNYIESLEAQVDELLKKVELLEQQVNAKIQK